VWVTFFPKRLMPNLGFGVACEGFRLRHQLVRYVIPPSVISRTGREESTFLPGLIARLSVAANLNIFQFSTGFPEVRAMM